MWIAFAFLSALFAGVTSILAKCGIRKTDSTVATAIRTAVVLVFSWAMVFIVGSQTTITTVDWKTITEFVRDAFIGVDLITGVRGETEALFEESRQFVENLDISQLHVFTYSERAGTQALKIEPIVPVPERHDRCRRMLEISDKKLHEFYVRFQGSTRPVLFEQPRKGAPMHGFTDNYIRVEMPFRKEWVNTCRPVRLGDFNPAGDALMATEI